MDALSLGQFGELLASLGGVTGVAMFLTEFAPFGATGSQKKWQALVYSLSATFVFYVLGMIQLPNILAKEVVEAGPIAVKIAQAISLGFAAFCSWVAAWGTVDIYKWAKNRSQPPAPPAGG